MRSILSLFTCLCLSVLLTPAYAQTYYSDNFDSTPSFGSPGFGWGVGQPYLVGLYEHFDIPGENGNNKVAAVADGGQDNYNALKTTLFVNLTTAIHPWLQYDSYFLKFSNGVRTERATVEVSTDTGSTWTVLQDVPPCPTFIDYRRLGVNLSAYAGQRILIGFRYSDDSGFAMRGWAIDNIKVAETPAKNIVLEYGTPNEPLMQYAAANTNVNIGGRIRNEGSDTIKTFIAYYQQGSGLIQQHTFTNLSVAPFDSYDFTHNTPWTIPSIGAYPVNVWVWIAGDTSLTNNQDTITLNGSAFKPVKVPVVEQTNQTWNKYGPRGIVYFDQLAASDKPVNLITVHGNDPMDYYDYDHVLGNMFPNVFNHQPAMFIDRKIKLNPAYLLSTFEHDRLNFGFAEMGISIASITPTVITFATTVRPAVNMTGNYRLAVVLTEDKLSGTTAGWDQRNRYAGWPTGWMGGYELQPDPVPAAEMVYNYIARTASPSPEGGTGYLPLSMAHSTTYSYSFAIGTSPGWKRKNMKAIFMLIKASDSTILNSVSMRLSTVNVPGNNTLLPEMNLWPNPSNDQSVLSFLLTETGIVSLTVTDISGKVVYRTLPRTYIAGQTHQLPVNTVNMASGLYLVTLQTEEGRQTLKLNVLH